MARILMVWELGSGMGHMDRMLVIARALRERHHDVRFALRDLSRAHSRIAAEGFMMMQTPVWLPHMGNPPRLGNYSAILASAGWLSPPGLAGLIVGWRSLFSLIKPDLIICDHAPTALLAARGQDFLTLAVGNSFEVPPVGDHFPPMAYWLEGEEERCPTYDSIVLTSCNEALKLLGDQQLKKLPDLFSHAHQAIVSLPQFNHYKGYPKNQLVLGPAFVDNVGLPAVWPNQRANQSTSKIFAYLAPTYSGFEPLMTAIKSSGITALVHAKGISAAAASRLGGSNIRFESNAIRLDEALPQAQIVVSHASLGTVCAAALAGKVQLGLPQHMEQEMVSRCLVETGAGIAVPVGSKDVNYSELLRRLTTDPKFALAAKELQTQNADQSASLTGKMAAQWIESLL
jgi:UDP:flavonoid glycosyltransferase YjiC (YdhE family)